MPPRNAPPEGPIEAEGVTPSPSAEASPDPEKSKGPKREIKGGLPYTPSPGVFKKALEGMIVAERPERFSGDFMETVLKLSGGAARAVPPLLKKMQFVGADGAPSQLYSRFKTDSGRSQAAYEGLRNAFGELFKRNEYIHKADEGAVKDVIVEITGLKKNDAIVRYIYQSFDAVRSYVTTEPTAARGIEAGSSQVLESPIQHESGSSQVSAIGLSYHINIVLPESDDIAVFNAIFRSLKENLLP
jgi:hypothetical protein